jgi:DNA-directed RNA polymerase sigma subunit (sigma70/sigma32)
MMPANLRLVISVSRLRHRYQPRPADLENLIQEGVIGAGEH